MTIIARIYGLGGRVALISAQPEPPAEAMYLGRAELKIEGGPYIEGWEHHINKIALVVNWAREQNNFDFMVKTLHNYSDIISVEAH